VKGQKAGGVITPSSVPYFASETINMAKEPHEDASPPHRTLAARPQHALPRTNSIFICTAQHGHASKAAQVQAHGRAETRHEQAKFSPAPHISARTYPAARTEQHRHSPGLPAAEHTAAVVTAAAPSGHGCVADLPVLDGVGARGNDKNERSVGPRVLVGEGQVEARRLDVLLAEMRHHEQLDGLRHLRAKRKKGAIQESTS